MPKNLNELSDRGTSRKILSRLANALSYRHTPEDRNCGVVNKYERIGQDPSQDLPKGSVLERLIDFCNVLNPVKYKPHLQQICDHPLQKIRLKVNTDLSALAEVLEWYEELEELAIPQEVWWRCQIALAEGFTNAVRHAHKGMPLKTPIELEVRVFNQRLEIRIWDYGQPFDLHAKVRELKEIDLGYWLSADCWRGCLLMDRIADCLSYTRTADNRNCLLIVKHFESENLE